MSRLSNTFSITIQAAGSANYLQQQAALMVAGEWRRLTNPANVASVLTGQGGSSGSMCLYSNKMQWNAQNKCVEYVGADHGSFTSMNFVRYSPSSHSWAGLSGTFFGSDSGVGPGHGFDQHAVNPYSGQGYYRKYGSGINVARSALNASTFATQLPLAPAAYVNINAAAAWWSGSLSGSMNGGTFTAGAQGALMIYVANSDGEVFFYDPLSGIIDYKLNTAPGSADRYQQVCAYSAVKNCAVYGGYGGSSKQLWKMTSNMSVTAMPVLGGGGNTSIGVQSGNLIADPVSGNFLVLTNGPTGELWQLNPDGSGSWTQKTSFTIDTTQVGGSRTTSSTPPSYVAVNASDSQGAGDGTIWCDIPDYGVIMVVIEHPSAWGSNNHTTWLYKHA